MYIQYQYIYSIIFFNEVSAIVHLYRYFVVKKTEQETTFIADV